MVFEFARGMINVSDRIPLRQRQANDAFIRSSWIGKFTRQMIEVGEAEDIHGVAFVGRARRQDYRLFLSLMTRARSLRLQSQGLPSGISLVWLRHSLSTSAKSAK